ncbi:MAG: hypothetical protein GF315_09495 [candidate division Zixibacteria bacterium]|nr:hypothetical protein [candidate division Zixibacteria bacterium]
MIRLTISVMLSLLSFSLAQTGHASITLTEVLANEPGRSVYLEWIEVYNNSNSNQDISGWSLIEDGDTNTIPDDAIVPAKGFAVLARHPISEDDSQMSFERYWGDSSGVWGDHPSENYPLIEVKMTLKNSSGKVVLAVSDDSLSGFTWFSDAGDRTSYEKQDINGGDILSNWAASSSPSGSTPGNPPGSVNPVIGDSFSFEVSPEVIFLEAQHSVELRYSVPEDTDLTIELYDINGVILRTINSEELDSSGLYELILRNDSGNLLTGGIYILYARAEGNVNQEIKRVLVVAGQ